jgi:geranylgeranylglycerol-phosphate geranylgeranyltransferase
MSSRSSMPMIPTGRRDWVRVKALAHLEMMRPYTMFHAGLLAVAGAEVASAGAAAGWRVALAALVTICGWEAGLYAGDYYDRELDAGSKPFRPVPSGRVSPREAFTTMLALIAAGYVAALALGVANLALAVLTTALGIAYSKTFKGHAILGNFDRGVLGVCAVAFGALAGGGRFSLGLALLVLVAFFHDAATNLVGAIRDIEGDRAAGCRTAPVVYGLRAAAWIAGALAAAWMLAAGALMIALRAGGWALALFAAAVALAVWTYGGLLASGGRVARTRALAMHKWLVAERILLTCAVIAVFVPAGVALALAALALAASLGAQALLRDRYELRRPPVQPSISMRSRA